MIARYGDVKPLNAGRTMIFLSSPDYPFHIAYPGVAFFSPSRLFHNGSGLLIFYFLCFVAVLFSVAQIPQCLYLRGEAALRHRSGRYRSLLSTAGERENRRDLWRGNPCPLANTTAQWRSPAEFIPLAERTGPGYPTPLVAHMAQVARQMRPIFSKLPDGFHIGVNVSASHINAPSFIDDCLRFQRGFEGTAVKLMLEITEQEPLLLNEAVVDKLNALHSRGFPSRWTTLAPAIPGFSYLHELVFDLSKSIRVLSAG